MKYYSAIKRTKLLICYDNLDECQTYYAKWKEPVSKGYIPYVSYLNAIFGESTVIEQTNEG